MIAEAEKSKKAKVKISDLIARLEQIAVPDTPVSAAHDDSGPVNSVICASESEAVTFTEQIAAAEQLDESTVHTSEEVNQTSDGLLYPNLVATDAPDLPVAMIAETLSEDKPTETSPAQPSTLEKVDCVECVLPSALSHDYLRNLYISHFLESLSTKEEEFLQEVDGVRRGSASDNTEKDPFEVLLLHYAHVWNQWSHALDRFRMVNAEIEQMSHKLWDVRKKCNSVTGKCKDGVSVSLEYEYEEAELDHSAVAELAESEGVIRWVVFEELPSVAYSLSQLRNQINEHLLSALTSSPRCRNEADSEPVNLLDCDPDPVHWARIRTLRSICSTLFSVIRRQARGPQGRSRDSIFRKQLHDWTLLTAGTLLRSCRPDDHLFLLMQLLRLPSYHMRGLLGILNPPDPSLAWNRCTNLVDFLHQPEVELLLSLFAACLRPVRNRHGFLTSSDSELHDLLTASSDSPPRQASESRWTVVDSGGESDQEDSVLLSSRRQVDLPTPPESPSVDSASSIFVGPRDLEALLRQLNFERLIRLLVCDNTRPTKQYAVIGSGSGLLTLLAFADQLLDLIQSCGAIYSDHLGAPNPRTHLGCWRILAKRLTGLISLLVLAIGSRIRHAWIQQTTSESCVDFRRVISQYDCFCLRAANCLLSGCGLPSTHHEAVRLVCWRSFVALFPFGLTSSRSKVDLLNCILASILPSWSTSSSVSLAYLPGQVVNSLHRALLSIGLNDVGLEAFLTALGNLAALECRPVVTASAGPGYQLPSMEADLIRAIVQILFAVSVFHTSCANEGDSQPTGALGLMPVAPECGRRQLTSITYAHAHISLPLLFDLIVSVCSRISREVPLKPSRWSFILTVPSPTGQPFRVQELLVALSTELPLHLLQPEASHVATLITWLVDRSPETFEHVLARTILQRLNWESVVDSNTGESFIPFRLHLDLALALAQLVDNRLLYPSRFNAIVYHPVVNRVLSSTKSSASFAVGAFLTSLGYRQLQIQRPVTAATDRQPRGLSRRSDVLLSSYPFDSRRSKSNAPTSEVDGSVDASKLMLSWCVDLLLRLHLPGCAAPLAHQQPSHSLGNTNDLSRVWKLLSSMQLERNPVASFLLISLNMQLFGQSSAPSSETSVYRLVNTVIDCQQTNLVLRTLSLLFHQYATSTLPVTCPDFAQCLSRVFHLHKYEQLHPIAGSTFIPLIVGACLDACLAQPYSCSGLLVSLHDCLTQPGWSQSLDRVSLLEALLQITMWIHNSYIPNLLSSKPHVTNWHQSTLFQSFKIVLKHTYASQSSTSSSGWADRFVTLSSVASWAWFRSTGVLQGLKDRILGDLPSEDDSNPPSLPSNSFSLSDAEFSALFGTHRSMLFTLWLEICTLQSSPHDYVDYLQWSAHPFWILSAAFVADLEQQTFADGNPADHTAVWARLSAVLITHLDELITVFHNPGAPISSDCPIGTSLALLLERLLLEADVLCPDSANPTGAAGQAQSVALVTRIRAELIQISVIQGVSLLDTCPTSHPAFILLLHTLLSHLFGIRRALSSQPECHTPCNLFPVGFALLRCLPWFLFHIPFLAPVEYTTVKVTNEPNGQVDSRSLLDVLLARLRKQLVFYGGITDNPAEQSKCIRAIQAVITLLSELDNRMSRGRFFNLGQTSTALDPIHQRDAVDALLDIFDWRTLSTRLQHYTQLWSQHRLSSVTCAPVPTTQPDPPRNLLAELCARSAKETRHSICDIPLSGLLAVSVSSSLPPTVDKYSQHIQVLRNALSHHVERFCDRIAMLEQLQTKRRNTLLPNLYRVVTVKKTDQIECKPILPTWMTGSKGCTRGAILTAEYQTMILNEKFAAACDETCAKVNELLDAFVTEIRSATSVFLTDVLARRNKLEHSSWSDIAFQIEWTVENLLRLSRSISDEYNVSTLQRVSELRTVGIDCFEQLCRNLSGPLLQCPMSKKLISHCIQQLAEEFLTTLSTGYERILDLLVALPHLSTVLLRAFIPPDPASFSASVATRNSSSHPLLPIYERLMDIRFRCGAKVANDLLAAVDVAVWFNGKEERHSIPINHCMALVQAICKCVMGCEDSREAENPVEFDASLHTLCCEHLRAILNSRLSDLLDPFFALMLQETRYFGSQSIWTCLLDVMNNEVVECGGLSSSTESVSALLNSLGASLSNQPSSTLPTATAVRESLLGELLHSTGENVTLTVIAILGRLIFELGAKLGACVRENHMTAQSASSMLMEQLLHILGPFMQKSASAAIEGLDSPDGLNHRYLSILEASLASSSDALRRVSQVCPPHVDPAWSCLLYDSFIHWLMSATFPCGNQDNSRPSLPGFNPHIGALSTGPPSAPVGSALSVPLFAALCAIKDSALAGTGNDPKLFTFSWAAWRPSIATLNAMIQVLLKSRELPRPFSGISTASAMIALLGPIEWPTAYHSVDVTRQFVSSHWGTTEQSTGLNFSEMQSSDLRVAFLESLSFLLVLLTLLARNGDTELRNNLQQILEAVLSDLHFSHVNDRCYSLILSHLVEAHLPAYCVLMPPTCLEGRLFGLMASVAGMISTSASSDGLSPPEYQGTSVYPRLPTIPSMSAELDRVIHRKRLAYVHKIITLLQCAILRGDAPELGLDDLLPDSPSPRIHHVTIQEETLLNRITQPVGTLLRRFLPYTLIGASTSTQTAPDSYTNMDRIHLLVILGRLRVGNLLSELEAVAGSVAWENTLLPKFKLIAELCHELFRLLSVVRPAKPTAPDRNSSGDRFFEQPTTIICEAAILWLLGDSDGHSHLVYPMPSGIMPHSINAGLSLPICYTLLSFGQLDDECTCAALRVLESAVWSALTLAPSSIHPNERFRVVADLFRAVNQSTNAGPQFLSTSTSWTRYCLHEGLPLPLLLFALNANKESSNNSEQHSMLVADLLHCLSTINLQKVIRDGSSIHLHGLLLLIAFTVNVTSTPRTSEPLVCCSSHPAWRHTPHERPIAADASECVVALHVIRLHSVFRTLYESATKLRSPRTSSSLDISKEHAQRFASFIVCLGILTEDWLTNTIPDSTSVDSFGHIADCSSTNPAGPNEDSALLASTLSSMRARLPLWTTIGEGCCYLILEFWPQSRACFSQILTFLLSSSVS